MRTQWPTEDVIGPFRGEYKFLSNFHETQIRFYNTYFPTAEHAYQAGKALDSPDLFHQIRQADSPKEAKRLSRQASLSPAWDQQKIQHMIQVVTAKFTQHSHLRRGLLQTGDRLLVELNWWGDKYWGADVDTGEGQNKLGQTLMGVRNLLHRTHIG